MSFRASFAIQNPDYIGMSLTISMSLGEWKTLQEKLIRDTSPADNLWVAISQLVRRAEESFDVNEEELVV